MEKSPRPNLVGSPKIFENCLLLTPCSSIWSKENDPPVKSKSTFPIDQPSVDLRLKFVSWFEAKNCGPIREKNQAQNEGQIFGKNWVTEIEGRTEKLNSGQILGRFNIRPKILFCRVKNYIWGRNWRSNSRTELNVKLWVEIEGQILDQNWRPNSGSKLKVKLCVKIEGQILGQNWRPNSGSKLKVKF